MRLGLKRYILGNRQTIAGTVYGTILVLSIIAAGARSFKHELWQLDVLAATSAIVFWIAHVYSHGLGESLRAGRRLNLAEFRAIARREYSIVLAAVGPVVAITLGAVGVFKSHVAVSLAFAIGVTTLGAQGVRYARLERLSRTESVITVVLNLVFGLSIVAVEVFVTH
jgi:hypothetical protein